MPGIGGGLLRIAVDPQEELAALEHDQLPVIWDVGVRGGACIYPH